MIIRFTRLITVVTFLWQPHSYRGLPIKSTLGLAEWMFHFLCCIAFENRVGRQVSWRFLIREMSKDNLAGVVGAGKTILIYEVYAMLPNTIRLHDSSAKSRNRLRDWSTGGQEDGWIAECLNKLTSLLPFGTSWVNGSEQKTKSYMASSKEWAMIRRVSQGHGGKLYLSWADRITGRGHGTLESRLALHIHAPRIYRCIFLGEFARRTFENMPKHPADLHVE